MSNLISFLPVAFVVIVIVHEKLRQNKIRNEYDEMQLAIRGKGAWYGFYTGRFVSLRRRHVTFIS